LNPALSVWRYIFLFVVGTAQANTLNVPLTSENPKEPIKLIADETWYEDEIIFDTSKIIGMGFEPFTSTNDGPVTLVVDYGATRANTERGEALLELSLECPDAQEPCKLPLNKAFMKIDSAFMGEAVAFLNNEPTPIWVGRASQTFSFPPGTVVNIGFDVANEPVNLQPKIIRARLIYGSFDAAGLPGQQTRSNLFYKITGSALLLLLAFVWWIRRQ
jgi:hypothetical protein